jgi:hypothetical protein
MERESITTDIRLTSLETDMIDIKKELLDVKSVLVDFQECIVSLAVNQKKIASNLSTWPYIVIENDEKS